MRAGPKCVARRSGRTGTTQVSKVYQNKLKGQMPYLLTHYIAGEGGVAVDGAAAADEVVVAVMTIIPRADLSEAPARSLASLTPILGRPSPLV